VTMDRMFVSFMRSFPNLIPLSRAGVESIVAAVAPFRFDRIYGAWWDRHIESDAAAAVARSRERYVAAIEGKSPLENTVSINRVSGDAVGLADKKDRPTS